MSKFKNLVVKATKAYFNAFAKAYNDNVYRYQYRF